MRFRIFIIAFLFACAPSVRAQCDSTPPLLQPAFAIVGDSINEHFGEYIYVMHDTSGHAHLVVNVGVTDWAFRDYSRFASPTDTVFRCCIPYSEAHECHVTGSKNSDYVVNKRQVGADDSIFLIPGSPEGIWSQRKWLLMTPAADAQIAVGKFVDTSAEVIVIGNFHRGISGSIGYHPGQLWVWRHLSSTNLAPDTIVNGDTADYAFSNFGVDLTVGDLDNDGVEDLCVWSGGGYQPNHNIQRGLTVVWGGQSFLEQNTRWRDEGEALGWSFSSPPRCAHIERGDLVDLTVGAHLAKDTVWSAIRSGWRTLVYRGVRGRGHFDTTPSFVWRPPSSPNRTCIDGILKFGSSLNVLSDVSGNGQTALAIGADGSFNASGGWMLYMGGNEFDTIPDAYFKGASTAIGGIDFNNDSIGDIIIPRPGEGIGGVVQFVAGSRAFRSFGVNAVHDAEPPHPQVPTFTLFPLPARRQVTLSWNGSALPHGTVVGIVDMLGRVVRRVAISAPQQMITLDGLVPGVYRLTWVENTHSSTQSFIHVQ